MNESFPQIDQEGNVEWRTAEGLLHRIDGPAVEGTDGRKEWWVNGKYHRIGGPAVEWADGAMWWYFDGRPHRTDGPAIEGAYAQKEWWIEGELRMDLEEKGRI